jgi:hypothetical protein
LHKSEPLARRETNSSQPVHRATFGQVHCGVEACELYHCQGAGIALNVPVVAGGKEAEVRSAGATVELRRR